MKASKFQKEEHKKWRNYDIEWNIHYHERDFQRQKAYDAEDAIKSMLINNTRFESIEDIQKFVDKICKYKWFRDRWGDQKIKALDGKNQRTATGNFSMKKIKIPMWAWDVRVILHELAHAITPTTTGGGHGRYWAATYLELVEKVMGKKDFILLRGSFKTHKVKYNQKRRLSEEVKEKMRSHMAKIRETSPIA